MKPFGTPIPDLQVKEVTSGPGTNWVISEETKRQIEVIEANIRRAPIELRKTLAR